MPPYATENLNRMVYGLMNREVRFGLQTLGMSALLGAVGFVPTVRLAGESVVAMWTGIGVSLAGSWAGAVPVAMSRGSMQAAGPANLVLAAMMVRLFVVLALALSIALSGKVDRVVFLVWVGISYLVLLAADTNYLVKSAASFRKEQT